MPIAHFMTGINPRPLPRADVLRSGLRPANPGATFALSVPPSGPMMGRAREVRSGGSTDLHLASSRMASNDHQ
jgi:hypothetical protein